MTKLRDWVNNATMPGALEINDEIKDARKRAQEMALTGDEHLRVQKLIDDWVTANAQRQGHILLPSVNRASLGLPILLANHPDDMPALKRSTSPRYIKTERDAGTRAKVSYRSLHPYIC